MIAENVLTRVDSDGFIVTLLEAIRDYKKDDPVVQMTDNRVITSEERKRMRKITQGWKLKVI